jgi:RNA polymerase sigma factor (sigma-70 family)
LHAENKDIDLWSAFQKGDKMAFAELFRRHYSLLYQYGTKLSGPTNTVVEDCIQELFIELWQSRSVTAVQSVKAYLLTALKYKIFKTYRSTPAKSFEEVNDHIQFDIGHENFMIAQEEDLQKTGLIIAALKQLPSRQKEIVYLKVYQNLGYEEISEVMGINYQVSRNLFSQAIKSLRRILSPE